VRALACLVVLMNCILLRSYASTPAQPQPLASLELSLLLPTGSGEPHWMTVAFASETSIAIGLCPRVETEKCSLSLVRWDTGVLRPFAQTLLYEEGAYLHPVTEGRILTTGLGSRPALYSADLSELLRLPSSIIFISPRGNTVAENAYGNAVSKTERGWKVYRLSAGLELVREGKGSLRSVSDEVVVFQDHDVMRTESLKGIPVGAFSVKPETKCYNNAAILAHDRLYLRVCKGKPIIADFNGRELLKLDRPKGCCDENWSADGRRLLFDYTSRQVSVLRAIGEIAWAATTSGAGEEMDNREKVQVVDTVTGASCFEWRRRFAMGSEAQYGGRSAISPSGEFVAIAADKTLSVYRLPAACETRK